MGYFANGTEGEAYEAHFCARCVHQKPDGKGCAVMSVHFLFAYEECNSKSNASKILEAFIPRRSHGNGQCTMFVTVDTVRQKRADRRQLPLLPGGER